MRLNFKIPKISAAGRKYLRYIFMGGFTLLLFISGLTWMGLFFATLLILSYLLNRLRWWDKLKKVKIIYGLVIFVLLITFSILLRLFVMEIYAIPSNSMENALITGDKILISKLAYGPRLPSSVYEIPWVNIAYVLCKREAHNTDSVWWTYHRWKGHGKINRNDVLVFEGPFTWGKMVLVKRCMGLPGDTLLLSGGQIMVNGDTLDQPGTVRYHCRYRTRHPEKIKDKLAESDKDNVNGSFISGDNGYQHDILSPAAIRSLVADPQVDTVIVPVMEWQNPKNLFPNDTSLHWTWNEYGPVTVPFKGMELTLDKKSYKMYIKELTHFENSGIEFRNDSFYQNGKEVKSYTFQNNYYWMMGDNRNYSLDSREWGFVREDHLIGKAWMIMFSNTDGKFNWKRFVKKIK